MRHDIDERGMLKLEDAVLKEVAGGHHYTHPRPDPKYPKQFYVDVSTGTYVDNRKNVFVVGGFTVAP